MSVKIVETNLDFTSLTERSITDMIVIHHTGGNDIDASAEQIHGWHKNQGWAGIGYHYVIRKDGTIERGRPEWAIGSHAYGENSHTIGIHISGDFDSAEPTEKQIENCAELVADICTRYGIPIDTSIFDYLRDQFLEYNLHVIFMNLNYLLAGNKYFSLTFLISKCRM